MDQPDRPLLESIDAFLASESMSAVTFGRAAMRDPHFVRDVRGGRRLWPETEAKVRHFMSTYTPEQEAAAA